MPYMSKHPKLPERPKLIVVSKEPEIAQNYPETRTCLKLLETP